MRLIIPAAVEAKIHAYVRSVHTEIAGMGKAKIDTDGNIMLLDVVIYEQEVTGGTADLSSEALAKFQTELIRAGESPVDWIVWWHSHADMPAFFSKRDTDTIDDSSEFNHLISLVVNKKRERKARIDLYHPFRFTRDDIAIIVGTAEEVIPDEIRAEVAAKVKIKTYGNYSGEGKGLFGRHSTTDEHNRKHGGKGLPARSADDYGASASGIKSINKSDLSALDREDLEVLIGATNEAISGHKQRGTEDSYECQELMDDLDLYEKESAYRDEIDAIADSYGYLNEKN